MMRRRKWIAAALSAVMFAGLAACDGGTNQTSDETEPPAVSGTAEQTAAADTSRAEDAADYVGSIENANIDSAVYLDYSAGIEAGVYKWILSEDGDYYAGRCGRERGAADSAGERHQCGRE